MAQYITLASPKACRRLVPLYHALALQSLTHWGAGAEITVDAVTAVRC